MSVTALCFKNDARARPLGPARRRDPRIVMALPVGVRVQGRTIELVACDVSLRGLFVLTAEPRWKVNELVRLDLGTAPPLRLLAVVVRVVAAGREDGHPAGFAVQF